MARIKKGVNAKKKHKKVLKLAKGYYGAKSKLYRPANEAVMRALRSSYRGRKEKKRNFRRLWITRINAGARMYGLSYSKFMFGLKQDKKTSQSLGSFFYVIFSPCWVIISFRKALVAVNDLAFF